MIEAINGKIMVNANITSGISEQIDISKIFSKTYHNPTLGASGTAFPIYNRLFAAAGASRPGCSSP
jgi:hypothetical protein